MPAEAEWGGRMAYGIGSHQMYSCGDRVDAEVGYGLPVGARFVGRRSVRLTISSYGGDYRAGYGVRVLKSETLGLRAGRGRAAARERDGGRGGGFE